MNCREGGGDKKVTKKGNGKKRELVMKLLVRLRLS